MDRGINQFLEEFNRNSQNYLVESRKEFVPQTGNLNTKQMWTANFWHIPAAPATFVTKSQSGGIASLLFGKILHIFVIALSIYYHSLCTRPKHFFLPRILTKRGFLFSSFMVPFWSDVCFMDICRQLNGCFILFLCPWLVLFFVVSFYIGDV